MRPALFDRIALPALIALALALTAKGWLDAHPEHNPWAPLDLNDPPGWATARKLAALRSDASACRAVLARSGVAFTGLVPTADGACARPDRTVLDKSLLSPARPATTCAVAAGLELWMRRSVQPAARDLFGAEVVRVEHLGSYSCRRVYGRSEGAWSEHSTGNAIDVAAFVLADGRRISVMRDWQQPGEPSAFLHRVRDDACGVFGTVLSPDYNAAHRDHLHLDQASRAFGTVCR